VVRRRRRSWWKPRRRADELPTGTVERQLDALAEQRGIDWAAEDWTDDVFPVVIVAEDEDEDEDAVAEEESSFFQCFGSCGTCGEPVIGDVQGMSPRWPRGEQAHCGRW
jgi:hypothetical protein